MLSPTPLRALFLGLSTAFLITPVARPQGRAPTPRIVSAIDENSLRRLDGNVPHAVSTAIDQGEADSATQLTHIRLVLSRTPAQEAALDRYLAELQDKSSPNFHKWLTPERFGALYGPARVARPESRKRLEGPHQHCVRRKRSRCRRDIPCLGTLVHFDIRRAVLLQHHRPPHPFGARDRGKRSGPLEYDPSAGAL